MKAESIILSGPSGVGKSTVADELCSNGEFKRVQSVTTREPRSDDRKNRYKYIEESEFEELNQRGELLIWAEYRGKCYGVKKEAYMNIVESDQTPLLIITPESTVECIIEQDEVDEEKFISIFLDIPDEKLDKRLSNRADDDDDDHNPEEKAERRDIDRSYSRKFSYKLQNITLEDTVSAIRTIWKYRDRSGILPREYIQNLVKCRTLIKENLDLDSISHASYDLRLGDEFYQGGEIQRLDVYNPFITIDPYDYAIVMSKETVSFPRDIAGRFDLTVGLFCQGVILSNGPQIDPGFEGRLFCLLFNTSDAKVQIRRKDNYATLELRKLLSPTDPYEGTYQGKDHIVDYLPEVRMQGAVSQLKDEIDQMKEERERLQQVVFTRNITIALGFISFVLAMIAIVVAVLSSSGL